MLVMFARIFHIAPLLSPLLSCAVPQSPQTVTEPLPMYACGIGTQSRLTVNR